jgi:hypothetical protein
MNLVTYPDGLPFHDLLDLIYRRIVGGLPIKGIAFSAERTKVYVCANGKIYVDEYDG